MVAKHFFMLSLAGVIACRPEPILITPDAQMAQRSDVLLTKSKPNPDLDLLFVIDDSPSMLDKQNALARAIPALHAQMSAIPGGMPNLHVGVVTSDMGTSARDDQLPAGPIGSGPGSCSGTGKGGVLQTSGAAITGSYLTKQRDGTQNYTSSFTETVATMIGVGATGCGFEQPLSAMRAALTSNVANTGFLRAGANLAVIVLSDEDDCSVRDTDFFGTDSTLGPLQSFRCFQYGVECTPDEPLATGTKTGCRPRAGSLVEDVSPFKDFLVSLKGDARKLLFGAIVGDPSRVAVEIRTPPGGGTPMYALEHSCSYTTLLGSAVADPGVRFKSFVDTFPGRAVLRSICSDDLTPATTAIGTSIRRLVGDTCLERAIAEPADCVVEDISDSAATAPVQLPVCASGVAGDCYTLVADASCTDGAPLRLAITRVQPPADDTWTRVRCTTL